MGTNKNNTLSKDMKYATAALVSMVSAQSADQNIEHY